MTEQEFVKRQDNLLSQIPEEFRGSVSFKAYQDGHAYGYEEILNHVEELVGMILTPLKNYTNRIKGQRSC